MAHASAWLGPPRGGEIVLGERGFSERAAILPALADALIVAAVALVHPASIHGAVDIARGMAAHPIVRIPARFFP